MRVIIAGSRCFVDIYLVRSAMREFFRAHGAPDEETIVVSGGAPGVDQLGERWAEENGCDVVRYPADWKNQGKAAGPIRNRLMAENADALCAIWDGKSRGTKNMIEEAKKRGLKTYIHMTVTL
jgi:SLOG family YspA-like protein